MTLTPSSQELIALAERASPGCVAYLLPDGRSFEVDLADDDNSPRVLMRAAEMAYYRGGQTHPICDYDIRHAREEINGEVDEIASLRRQLAEAKAALKARAHQEAPHGHR